MRYIIITLCLLCSVSAFAQQQSRADLEAKKKEIMDAINETQRQLDETKQNKNATIGQLRALQNKLAERQKLIGNINDEIGDIDNNIKSSSTEVTHLKGNLEQLKIHYAQSIRYAYETRSNYGMLAYMFSSSDFNDAMRRMKYLKKLRELREQQVEQIRITQAQLTHKIGVLNAAKAQKDELLNSQMQQKQRDR
jgi:septal ring factor EnvC (AmiA/AmiB activator)